VIPQFCKALRIYVFKIGAKPDTGIEISGGDFLLKA